MEYSVNDLIRILLRKWYVILLTMVIVAAAALFISDASYKKAVADYEKYTTERLENAQSMDMSQAVYAVRFTLKDSSQYQSTVPESEEERVFVEKYLESFGRTAGGYDSTYRDALTAYQESKKTVDALLGEETWAINESTEITRLSDGTIQLTSYAQGEDAAKDALNQAVEELNQKLDDEGICLDLQPVSYHYTPYASAYTESAVFSQMVMQKLPAEKPSLVRTVGTAAVYAFVFACVGILIVTFARDTAQEKKRGTLET